MPWKIGPKRTAIQVQGDRQVIAQLYLRGQTQQQIAQGLSRERPYTLTQQQIAPANGANQNFRGGAPPKVTRKQVAA